MKLHAQFFYVLKIGTKLHKLMKLSLKKKNLKPDKTSSQRGKVINNETFVDFLEQNETERRKTDKI